MQKNETAIAVYSRKSKFTGKGESIGNQVELCKEYIRAHYGEGAADTLLVYEDEGFSGGNLNRPAFKKMMDAAKKRSMRAIVVYRLDRISRNISDFSGLIEELDRLNISFVSIKEQFDTGTPMGRAMMYIASVFSQLERETIAERIRDNMRELAKTGRWLGGTTPTGYASEAVKSVTVDGKAKKACKLKLIAQEADNVKTIFALYAQTDSLTLTEAALMQRGVKTKNGKYFTRFSIKAILQNPVYVIADGDAYDYFVRCGADLFSDKAAFDGVHGVMAYNRTDQEKGKTTVFLPPSEWIVSVGEHPGIIPGGLWAAIQASLERNKSKAFRKPRSNEALLTGLLFCQCGERMYPKISKRLAADGNPAYAYVCKMKERSRRALCDSKNANGNLLDLAVMEQIAALQDDAAAFIAQLERGRGFYTCAGTGCERQLVDFRREKAETEKRIHALVDSLVDMGDGAAKQHVAERIEQLSQVCKTLAQRVRALEKEAAACALDEAGFAVLLRRLATVQGGAAEMTVEQKRAALRGVVCKVVWDGASAHLVLLGAEGGPAQAGDARQTCSDGSAVRGAIGAPDASIASGAPDVPGAHWGEDSK